MGSSFCGTAARLVSCCPMFMIHTLESLRCFRAVRPARLQKEISFELHVTLSTFSPAEASKETGENDVSDFAQPQLQATATANLDEAVATTTVAAAAAVASSKAEDDKNSLTTTGCILRSPVNLRPGLSCQSHSGDCVLN